MKKKNRNYHTSDYNGSIINKKGYLLRWYCDKENKVLQKGPYRNEEEAQNEQNTRLIKGICSWLVSYDG
jgi:hypothetical protein